uniref:Uncharacterized protein n=1 Tax=Aegilops tauschii subsp. strangulata TaxID=200361 RepID=A0A452Y7S8_AEGTS
ICMWFFQPRVKHRPGDSMNLYDSEYTGANWS